MTNLFCTGGGGTACDKHFPFRHIGGRRESRSGAVLVTVFSFTPKLLYISAQEAQINLGRLKSPQASEGLVMAPPSGPHAYSHHGDHGLRPIGFPQSLSAHHALQHDSWL